MIAVSHDDDLTTVRRAIDAMGELDIDAVFELLAADFVLELPFRADDREVDRGDTDE